MKKTLLTERFQELAGIKPLAEQPTMMDLGDMQARGIGPYADKDDKISADAGKFAKK